MAGSASSASSSTDFPRPASPTSVSSRTTILTDRVQCRAVARDIFTMGKPVRDGCKKNR